MKKFFFCGLIFFVAASASAQPVSIYQPPTPAAKMNITATPGASANGIAVDEFLNQYVRLYGTVTLAGTPLPTAAPVEITPIAQSVLQPTALPTLFPVTPNALVNSAALRALRINNGFNIDLNCTYGAAAATPLPFTVPAQSQHYENFAANGAKMSSGVSCIHPSSTPASGTLQVWGY